MTASSSTLGSSAMEEANDLLPPPGLERPRWWSNPGLRDRDTIIALVLDDPTTIDLARTMAHYGIDAVDRVRRETERERTKSQNGFLDTLYDPIRSGVCDALGRPA